MLIIIIGVPKGLGLLSRLPLPLQYQQGMGFSVACLFMGIGYLLGAAGVGVVVATCW